SGSGITTLGNALNIVAGASPGIVTVGGTATLAASGNLTIKSDALGTAAIANSVGTITGNVTFERFIPALAVRGRFRFLGSPVAGATVANWMNNFYITGPGTGATLGAANSNGWHTSNANIINATVTNTSVLTYNEADVTGDLNAGWISLSGTTQALTPGLGFRAFLRGTNNGTPTNATFFPQIGANANSLTQAAFTISLSGAITNTVNAGTVTLPVSFSNSNTLANDGWNLVANPYPSAIDWNATSGWTKTNIGGTIWIFNPTTNTYGNWDGVTPTNSVTGIISSSQAFFVKASATPTLSCTEAVKVSENGSRMFKGPEINTLRIGLVKDETNKDETVIRFMDGKKDEFSEEDDVTKYYNPTVNISSYYGINKYAAVNYLKNELNVDKTIPLSVWVDEAGTYKLNFTGMSQFSLYKNIFLKDKFLNTLTDIVQKPIVDFTITSDANTKGDNRFEIVFVAKGSTKTPEELLNQNNYSLSIYPNPASSLLNIRIDNANFKNASISIYNIAGTEVYNGTMNSTAQVNIENLSNGVYFLTINNENGFNKTVKFVK
ncbi:MAG: T9SS type A sorting domain-containing protein, partial [bacterium]|nr:T9SS type A sorting domain-containing protein [bacterium]